MVTRQQVISTLTTLDADRKHVWVAGSSAIYPEKADDIDIWVFPKSDLKVEAFNETLWEDFPAPSYGNSLPIKARRQATVPGGPWGDPVKIQVMFVENCKDIFYLLNCFDVSCHAWARNVEGYLVGHPKATFPGQPIHWINEPLQANTNYLCAEGSCGVCDKTWAALKAAHKPDGPTRLEDLTTRYAGTTTDLLWLPA